VFFIIIIMVFSKPVVVNLYHFLMKFLFIFLRLLEKFLTESQHVVSEITLSKYNYISYSSSANDKIYEDD
jgi:hypothetical protein